MHRIKSLLSCPDSWYFYLPKGKGKGAPGDSLHLEEMNIIGGALKFRYPSVMYNVCFYDTHTYSVM